MTRVVVIGAGIGGLVAALDLATRGCDVTLLEKEPTPGGKMRQVIVDGAAIDAGPTVLTMRWVFEAIFADAGTSLDAHVTLASAAILGRHAWSDTERLDLFADLERSVDAIGAFAGQREADGYRTFAARARKMFETLDRNFIQVQRPRLDQLIASYGLFGLGKMRQISPFNILWGALGEHFRDPRLRQLFGRYATYCGSSPFQAPATLMLVAHVEREGVWLVEGGMHALAKAVAALAESKGTRLRYGARVARIETSGGGVSGATLDTGERIEAEAIVLNADVAALTSGLFGSSFANAAPRIARGDRSLSAVTFTMNARTRGFPLVRHNVFFSRDYKAEFDAIFAQDRTPAEPTVYVCAQDRGDDDAPRDAPERLLALVNAPASGDARAFPPEEISRCEDQMHALLARCGLTIDTLATVTTAPSGFEALFPATGGALYGPASHGWQASFHRSGARTKVPGLYLAGGSVHPGPGVPMAAMSGRLAAAALMQDLGSRGPRFDIPVAENGYAWWYVDALSEDGAHGLTIIAFIGSVFSPYYALARARGKGDPENHICLNVALYGGPRKWAMTERGRASLARDADHIAIGPSAMRWDGAALTITIDETTVPLPSRLRGEIVVRPRGLNTLGFTLDTDGRHRWRPIGPLSDVHVSLAAPELGWQGTGYFDMNEGDEPLETAFRDWTWSRFDMGDGARIFYDVTRRDGSRHMLSLDVRDGGVAPGAEVAYRTLPTTGWRIPRAVPCEAPAEPVLVRTLETAPFYARSEVRCRIDGRDVSGVHETLSCSRLVSPVVRLMLPFKMPRRG